MAVQNNIIVSTKYWLQLRLIFELAFLFTAITCLQSSENIEQQYTNEWTIHIQGGIRHAEEVVGNHGYRLVRKLPFPDYYLLTHDGEPIRSKRSANHLTTQLSQQPGVLWAEQQRVVKRVKRTGYVNRDAGASFNDPKFKDEWYLERRNKLSKIPRESDKLSNLHLSLNVVNVWRMNYTGRRVHLSVLDDGIESNHSDLAENYDPESSYDLNDEDPDPFPRYESTNENKHGTRCAGEIAMVADNNVCGVGIAYNAKVGGVRMLDGPVTDVLESRALSHRLNHVDIFSASWGPDDDGKTVEGPGVLASKALQMGIEKGRGGRGVIYTWASGNGGRAKDNCNCDGYTSSIYTLSVSSATESGNMPWYGEMCSSTLTTTYSSGTWTEKRVVSTDLHNKCTRDHSGTSASAPLAAGILALLLEANPSVTWRDVQHLVVLSSKASPLASVDGWYYNSAGFCVNQAFGFGLLDAQALVEQGLPQNWTHVPTKSVCITNTTERSNLPQRITSGHSMNVIIHTDGCHGKMNEVNYLEHLQLIVNMTYSYRGKLTVNITSPTGTTTVLLSPRLRDSEVSGFTDWGLMSVHTWGEQPNGDWVVTIADNDNSGTHYGYLTGLRLLLHGTKRIPHYRLQKKTFCDLSQLKEIPGKSDGSFG